MSTTCSKPFLQRLKPLGARMRVSSICQLPESRSSVYSSTLAVLLPCETASARWKSYTGSGLISLDRGVEVQFPTQSCNCHRLMRARPSLGTIASVILDQNTSFQLNSSSLSNFNKSLPTSNHGRTEHPRIAKRLDFNLGHLAAPSRRRERHAPVVRNQDPAVEERFVPLSRSLTLDCVASRPSGTQHPLAFES